MAKYQILSSSRNFSDLKLKPDLVGNLADLGYAEMTLVQAETLPLLLTGADVLARAKTGSGKTAAFGLGILNRLDVASFAVQALADARELGMDTDRINVRGGAIALGHPIGASGAKILTTLLYAMRDLDVDKGMATLCLGGGNAVALSVERA